MATKTSTTSTSEVVTKSAKSKDSSTTGKEFSTADKIAALYELQQIDSRIDEINHIKGSLPLEVQDMEDAVVGAEEQIKKIASDIEGLQQAVKGKKEEIEQAKVKIAKYVEHQNAVRNNREFESIGKEIEYENLEIELFEKRIKEFNSEIKGKKVLAEEANDILKSRQAELELKRAELEGIEAESADELASLTSTADLTSVKIDERLLTAYKRIRKNTRNGLAVVVVERDACGGCFNRIPPQRRIDIEASKKVIVCEYCGRVLVSSQLAEDAE